MPRYIEFAPDLPTNAMGKVQRGQVDLKGLGLAVAQSEQHSRSSV